MGKYEKNLEAVKNHLKNGESIKFSVFGTYETKLMGNDFIRSGIFGATETRIIFFGKKMIGFDLESFPFENISSIKQSKKIMGHLITFYASRNKVSMKWIKKGEVQNFINYVESKIGKGKVENITSNSDIPSQIQKLSELNKQGILTDDEFNLKKSELLNKM